MAHCSNAIEPAKQAVAKCSIDCMLLANACAPQAIDTLVPAPSTASTETFEAFDEAFDEATAVAFELLFLAKSPI